MDREAVVPIKPEIQFRETDFDEVEDVKAENLSAVIIRTHRYVEQP